MLLNIVLCQLRVGGEISLDEKIHIFKRKPDFVCLPEYFLIPPESKDYSAYASRFDHNLKLLSQGFLYELSISISCKNLHPISSQ